MCHWQVESSLQAEFSKQLEAKDRSLKEEQEAMRSQLEGAIREKEAQMLAQLEAEKQAMIDEKQKVWPAQLGLIAFQLHSLLHRQTNTQSACNTYQVWFSRMMWTCVPGRKTDNVNALLVPSKRARTIKLPWLKNPSNIVNKIAGYDIWRQNLGMKTNKW